MVESAFESTPEMMSIVNLDTLTELVAQYNPEEITERIGANYSRHAVQGHSHQIKQFSHTEDLSVTFTMAWSGHAGPAFYEYIHFARRFLHSVHYPKRSAGLIAHAGPPRLLFVWPELFTLTAVMTGCTIHHQAFQQKGGTVRYTAAITLEEIRDAFISSEDVLEYGTERTPGVPARAERPASPL